MKKRLPRKLKKKRKGKRLTKKIVRAAMKAAEILLSQAEIEKFIKEFNL